jgi:ATP-binding cassette subfamily B multidrug efflux pump
VLQHGQLVEQGTHDTLIEHGGLYAQLYRLNYASFDDLPNTSSDEDREIAT